MKFNIYGLADKLQIRFILDHGFGTYDYEMTDKGILISGCKSYTDFDTKVKIALLIAAELKFWDPFELRDKIDWIDFPENVKRLAVDLLMPTGMLKKYKELLGSYYNLKTEDLGTTFGVSPLLVARKLEFIGIRPIW